MPSLDFEADTHQYRIDGHIVPSITQVIGASKLWDDTYWSEETAERGRYVHKAIELAIKGECVITADTRHGACLRGCIASWYNFCRDNPGKVVASEIKLCDPVFRFAGRLDLLYRFSPSPSPSENLFGVIDIKAGQPQPWHALQTAAQAHLIIVNKDVNGHPAPKSLQRLTLYLNETRYRVSVHQDLNDWTVFRSALTLAHWRSSNGKHVSG